MPRVAPATAATQRRHAAALWLRYFGPPRLRSADATTEARTLWITSVGFLAVVVVMLGVTSAIDPTSLERHAITLAAVAALIAILHEANRWGRTRIASWTFVVGLVLIVTQRAWGTGGIYAPISVFYVLFVLMAGGLIGTQASVTVAVLCAAAAGALTFAQVRAGIPAPTHSAPVSMLLFVVVSLAFAVVVESLYFRSLRLRLHQARAQLVAERRAELLMRDDLVAMIVHDMRAPLHALAAHLELMRIEAPAGLHEDIDGALDGAASLNRLANSLLDVARFEEGRMPLSLESADVCRLVADAHTHLAALAAGRNIDVRCASPMPARCDADVIRRVIENLLSNAIKYTPDGGTIRIEVTASSGRVRVAVTDEGPGVPEHLRQRIFDKFGTAAAKGAYHSVGLGLAFCRLAVEAHQGTIGVADATPHGSIFAFEIPVAGGE